MRQVWDSETGLALSAPLVLHSSWVTDLHISADCCTLLTAGDRLAWWRLPAPPPAHQPVPTIRRKLSLPVPRSRRASGGGRSHRNSLVEESGTSPPGTPPALPSPVSTPASLPGSPISRRRLSKSGSAGRHELLQTFDIQGSSVNRVWVNGEFSQFITVDDAGIYYILDELVPSSHVIK